MIVIELVIIAQSQSSSQGPSDNITIHVPTQALMKQVTSFRGFRVCVLLFFSYLHLCLMGVIYEIGCYSEIKTFSLIKILFLRMFLTTEFPHGCLSEFSHLILI